MHERELDAQIKMALGSMIGTQYVFVEEKKDGKKKEKEEDPTTKCSIKNTIVCERVGAHT